MATTLFLIDVNEYIVAFHPRKCTLGGPASIMLIELPFYQHILLDLVRDALHSSDVIEEVIILQVSLYLRDPCIEIYQSIH